MSEECTHDCSNCGAACSSRDAAPQHDAPNPNSSVKKVIGVVSGKGGVGKSMTSALLACAMARRGYHCGILDADITGPSIPKLFGIHGRAMADEKGCWPIQSRMGIDVMSINLLVENEEDPVVWRGPVIAGAVKQFWTDVVWKDVDFLFVDMPPGTGDVPLTVFQSLPVDGIVVVASPQELVSMIVAKAVNMAEMMKVPMLGVVENMSYVVCPDCGKHINVFGDSHVDEVAAKHHLPCWPSAPSTPVGLLSDAGLIETGKRIALVDLLVVVRAEELAGIVTAEAEGHLGQVVRAEGEEVRFLGDLVRGQSGARDLDHGADLVLHGAAGLGDQLVSDLDDDVLDVLELLDLADERDHDLGDDVPVGMRGVDVQRSLDDRTGLHGSDLRGT